jgi:tetratricopeptide (TPR) repeat protein
MTTEPQPEQTLPPGARTASGVEVKDSHVGGDVTGRDKITYNYNHATPVELTGSRLPARNPLFVGRADVLAQLAEALKSEGALAILTGYGGLGKTQTAIEFGQRYSAQFPGGVFFINAAQPDLVVGEVAACGSQGRLTLPNFDSLAQPNQVKAVQHEWGKAVPRLLVFDNAEDPKLIQQWRPASGGCRVLVTSRKANWPRTLTPNVFLLSTLARVDSLKLLGQGSERFASDAQANIICEQVGDLPLALQTAGAYLAYYGLTPAQYLAELQTTQSMLEHESLQDWLTQFEELPTGHTPNIVATFKTSYDRLRPRSEAQALPLQVFHLLAYCAPMVPLPREVLKRAAEVEEDKRLTEALRRLADVGLVTLDEQQQPSTHRLLQVFAKQQARLDPNELLGLDADNLLSVWMAAAVADLAIELNQKKLPNNFRPILPHVRELAQLARPEELKQAGRLQNALGYYLYLVANYEAARAAYEQAQSIDEKVYGPEHSNVARDVNNLGEMYRALGNLPKAQAAFEQALRIDEKALGPNHPQVATKVNNLGVVYQDLNNLAGAQAAFERALGIMEKAYGPDDERVATVINNLGAVYKSLGDLPKAQAAYERALAINEKTYGLEHPEVATEVNNLGMVYQAQRELAKAQVAFERALRIDEKAYGPKHANVARDVNNLGMVYYSQNELAKAQAAFERALGIGEKIYGAEHSKLALWVNNLGMIYSALGDLPKAQAALERALVMDEEIYGLEHPEVATLVNNLGLVYLAQNELVKAQAAFERALGIMEKQASNNPHTKLMRDNLEAVKGQRRASANE